MSLDARLRNANQAEVASVIDRRDFLKKAALAATAGAIAGRAHADYGSGIFTDDFEDGILHPEWTTAGNVAETGGNLELSVDGTTLNSSAHTQSYPDADQVMLAVFDGVTLPNGASYFVQIGNDAGSDYARIRVIKDEFGDTYFQLMRNNTPSGITPEIAAPSYELRLVKSASSVDAYVNSTLIGTTTTPTQPTAGYVGADTQLSNPLTAKVQSAQFQSASIAPPPENLPAANIYGLGVLAVVLGVGGMIYLRQRKSE